MNENIKLSFRSFTRQNSSKVFDGFWTGAKSNASKRWATSFNHVTKQTEASSKWTNKLLLLSLEYPILCPAYVYPKVFFKFVQDNRQNNY